ncbi:hypothetical protein BH10PSE7_BH10PSE7_10170 [soil metagenome]
MRIVEGSSYGVAENVKRFACFHARILIDYGIDRPIEQ